MLDVKIDFSDVIQEFGLSREESENLVESSIKELTASFARAWDNQAKINLNRTREEYRRSLVVVDKGRFSGAVILTGTLPNMLENGVSPFDMKLGFAASGKKKFKKGGGWYLTIPFRFGTPGIVGDSSAFSGILPEPVYLAIKEEKGPKPKLVQEKIPSPFNLPRTRVAIPKSRAFREYVSKSSIFAGLQREEKIFEESGTKQSQFVSFRRVSNLSDPDMFIHTGLQARNFAELALGNMDLSFEVGRIVDKVLENVNA